MKNGSPKEIFQKKEWAERVNHERLEKMKAEWSRDLQEPHQEQGREEIQQQGNSISQVPDIDQAPLRKKQLEEELDQPRKRSRGLEWVCNLQIHACVRDVYPCISDTGVLCYPKKSQSTFGSYSMIVYMCLHIISFS